MKNKAVYLLLFLLLITTLLFWRFTSAFTDLPAAGSLIHMPKQESIYDGISADELAGIQSFLPAGAALISPLTDTNANMIIKNDINRDGCDELIYCYRDYEHSDKIGVMVLSFVGGSWELALKIEKESLNLDFLQISDVTGDNYYELLVGWNENNSGLNGLDIYMWRQKEMSKIYSTPYSRLEVDNQRNDGLFGDRDKLIIWLRKNNFYYVDVVTWDNSYFVRVNEAYPDYYNELTEVYEKYENTADTQGEYWYARACAYMSAQKYSQATYSINRAIDITSSDIDLLFTNIIKAYCELNENNKEQAAEILTDVIGDSAIIKDPAIRNTLLMSAYYYMGKYYYSTGHFQESFKSYSLSYEYCEKLYGDNIKLFHYQSFLISKAMAQTVPYAFPKVFRP